jgi:general secretion pathway protein L
MVDQFKDWMWWWVDMLHQLFNVRSQNTSNQNYSITFKPDGLQISLGSNVRTLNGAGAFLAMLNEGEFKSAHRKGPVNIRFECDTAIIRKMTTASMPESRHKAAAHFDMQSMTPFRLADFYALNVKQTNHMPGAFYAVVKRPEFGALLHALDAENLKINTVSFEDRPQKFMLTQSALNGLRGKESSLRSRSTAAIIAFFAFIIPLSFANYSYRDNAVVNQIERSIEPLISEAKELRLELDKRAALNLEMQALRESIEDRKPAIAIWEELAQVLPDSSFLTDLTIAQDKVSIAGYTRSASAIIVALEASNIFDEVAFTSPVVKVPGREDDRFSIELKIGTK